MYTYIYIYREREILVIVIVIVTVYYHTYYSTADLRRRRIHAKTAQANIKILAREIPWPYAAACKMNTPKLKSLIINSRESGDGL